MIMDVNETNFTGITAENRGDLQEKAEASTRMENRKNAILVMGFGTAMAVLSLAVASHPLAEMVKSSNHLKEIKVAEAAKNARWEMTLGFLHQTVNDVLGIMPFGLRMQKGCIF